MSIQIEAITISCEFYEAFDATVAMANHWKVVNAYNDGATQRRVIRLEPRDYPLELEVPLPKEETNVY
ncbi:MAG: hypothetical protein GTN99_02760 [Candidatus Dadabacteria bacterium]|nr:hypothetical protein [Candidatus Dadabacteria bacterium]